MKFLNFFYTPFPRPKRNTKNIVSLLVLGVGSSIFIMLFKPYNIVNNTGDLFLDFILFSLGIIFFLSVYLMEFLIPRLFPKFFKKWTIGKATLWYPIVILFVSAILFFYKEYLAGFSDFTATEYLMLTGRVLGIGIIVSFFVLGILNFLNRRKISLLSSTESYTIQIPNDSSFSINLNEILYIVSDDNYVDLHLEVNGNREKKVVRSSLKNIEEQIVNPVTPIYRCHRKYLININHFQIEKKSSRSMRILLEKYQEEIPVSKQYMAEISKLL